MSKEIEEILERYDVQGTYSDFEEAYLKDEIQYYVDSKISSLRYSRDEEMKGRLRMRKLFGESLSKIEALTKEKQDLINIISDKNIELINVEKENEELRNKINESNYIIQLFVKGVNSLNLSNGASFKKPYLLAKELLKILKTK